MNFSYDNPKTEIRMLKSKLLKWESGRMAEEYGRRVKALVRENNSLKSKIASYEDRVEKLLLALKRKGDRPDELEEISRIVEKIIEENGRLREENGRLKREKEESDRKAKDSEELSSALRKQLGKSSANSSLPSSLDRPGHRRKRPNEYNGREKSSRRVGGQAGHPHHRRKDLEPTAFVSLPLTKEMEENKSLVKTGKEIRKKLVDVSFSVCVTEYKADVYLDLESGKETHAPFPKGVKDEVNYGPAIKTLTLWLSDYCNVSINKIRDLIGELTDGRVVPSTGFINRLQTGFADESRDAIASLENGLITSDFLHVDLTAGNLNGKQVNVFNFTNKSEVLYTYSESKSKEAMRETILGKFANALIHDHDTTFYSFGDREKHQECLSHLLRYLEAAKDESPGLTWHREMGGLFREMIRKRKAGEPVDYDRTMARYSAIIDIGLEEYGNNPPSKYEREGLELLKRLSKYSKENFLFLRNELVDCTNNVCERNLRKYKRKQKRAIVFRSPSSIESICAFLSIVETAKLNNRSGFKAIQSILG